jgi:endonuclease-3
MKDPMSRIASAKVPPSKKEKAAFAAAKLAELYPRITIPLDHQDPYTLLVAVVLSAQCTDKKVNEITPLLFAKARTPQQMVKLGIEEIQDIIRPCGLSPMKSKGIHGLSKIIVEKHGGQVPKDHGCFGSAAQRRPQNSERSDVAGLRCACLSG